MTRAQWGILIWLERQPGISQKELAELLEVEPITVARLIDRLEARGMVERRPDPRDRRIWRLHLQRRRPRRVARHRSAARRNHPHGHRRAERRCLDSLTEALLRMKTTLVQEAHAARRGADARTRDAPNRATNPQCS